MWYHFGSPWIRLLVRLEIVISLAFGIPDTASDHTESKLSLIMRTSGTKRNLSQMYKHQKQFSHKPKLKLMPKVNADPIMVTFASPRFSLFLHLHSLSRRSLCLNIELYLTIEIQVEAKEVIKQEEKQNIFTWHLALKQITWFPLVIWC